MLFIYYLSDGAIAQAVMPYKDLEEFYGDRAKEMSLVFGALYIPTYNDFVFHNFQQFMVKDGKLEYKDKTSLSFIRNI